MSTDTLPGLRSARRLVTATLALAALAGVAGCAPSTASSPAPSAAAAATPEEQMVEAITAGDADAVARLLEDGLAPDADLTPGGDLLTPLHKAVVEDQTAIVTLLLAAGADPNARAGGLTPLMLAATSASPETVTALLDGGGDATLQNGRTWGMYVIHYAARRGDVTVLSIILERSGGIDIPDLTLTTPLMYAASFGNLDATVYLLEQGADPFLIDENHATALDWAVEGGYDDISAVLQDAMAGGA